MPCTLTLNLAGPITSAEILDNYSGPPFPDAHPDAPPNAESQKAGLSQICRTLQGLIDRLNNFCDKIFAEHREEIARLSVEIAGRILAQKVQDKDYEIEAIVREALKNAPTRQDVVVHLNSEDLVQYQKLQQDDAGGSLAGIEFVADPGIGRAECLLETPRGIIKSMIDEHLGRIAEALKKAG